jgi:SOS-response transcriptional repressor LexA
LKEGIPVKPIPLLNRIPAGFPESYRDKDYPPGYADEYVSLPDVKDLNAFALKVEGDSMIPRLKPGEIVIVSPNRQWESGDIVVTKVKEEVSLKKIFRKETTLVLQPINPDYSPIILPVNDVRIIGKVILRVEKL